MSMGLDGATLLEVERMVWNRDYLTLVLRKNKGKVVFKAVGDCCSVSWVDDVNNEGAFPGTILRIEEKTLPDTHKPKQTEAEYGGSYDVLEGYGYKIVTTRGYCDVTLYNDSNGYYGGSLELDRVELEGFTPEQNLAVQARPYDLPGHKYLSLAEKIYAEDKPLWDVYETPFKRCPFNVYVFDAKGEVFADYGAKLSEYGIEEDGDPDALRVRGWGSLSYMTVPYLRHHLIWSRMLAIFGKPPKQEDYEANLRALNEWWKDTVNMEKGQRLATYKYRAA